MYKVEVTPTVTNIQCGADWISFSRSTVGDDVTVGIASFVTPGDKSYPNAFGHGVLSLLLALYTVGFDFADPRVARAIETSLDTLSNLD